MAATRDAIELRVARALAVAPDLADAHGAALAEIGSGLGWDFVGLGEPDAAGAHLTCVGTWASPRVTAFASVSRGLTLARGEGLPGAVWASGEPVWVGLLEGS